MQQKSIVMYCVAGVMYDIPPCQPIYILLCSITIDTASGTPITLFDKCQFVPFLMTVIMTYNMVACSWDSEKSNK